MRAKISQLAQPVMLTLVLVGLTNCGSEEPAQSAATQSAAVPTASADANISAVVTSTNGPEAGTFISDALFLQWQERLHGEHRERLWLWHWLRRPARERV